MAGLLLNGGRIPPDWMAGLIRKAHTGKEKIAARGLVDENWYSMDIQEHQAGRWRRR